MTGWGDIVGRVGEVWGGGMGVFWDQPIWKVKMKIFIAAPNISGHTYNYLHEY